MERLHTNCKHSGKGFFCQGDAGDEDLYSPKKYDGQDKTTGPVIMYSQKEGCSHEMLLLSHSYWNMREPQPSCNIYIYFRA
jgi:hypothetical protein